jgi:hypothetical protein
VPFVNRVAELTKAWKAFGQNINAGTSDKLNMIIINQMYGSGTTEFGRHLFHFQDERIEKLFDDVFKLDSPTHKILRETLPVYIDLQKASSEGLSLEAWLSRTIFVSTLEQCFNIPSGESHALWLRAGIRGIEQCVFTLLSMVLKPLFFHFDEIGVLPKLFPSLHDKDHPKEIFYEFWRKTMCIQLSGCFIYISGKNLDLENHCGAPGMVCNIRLALFRAQDIQDIIWDSDSPTIVGDKLLIPSQEKADEVVEWLFKMTTGVPAYVEFALQYMMSETQQQNRFVNWQQSDESTMMDILAKVPGLPSFATPEVTPDFRTLFEMGTIGVQVKANTPEGSKIADLASFHWFHITTVPDEPDYIQVVIPHLWSQRIMTTPDGDASLKELCLLAATDKGKVFERFIEKRILLTHFYSQKEGLPLSKAFPFLNGTMIQDEILTEYHLLQMGDRELSGSVLVRPKDNSATPDLVSLLPDGAGQRYMIGWQLKNCPNTCLTRSHMWAEIDKFAAILAAKGCRGGVFVIILNGKGDPTVESLRGRVTESAAIPSRVEKKGSADDASSSQFPPYQLLILTEEELTRFIGALNLKSLSLTGEDGQVSM